jgi:hypothetical protein
MTSCLIITVDMADCPKCGRSTWRVDVLGPGTALLPCGHVVPPEFLEPSGGRPEVREVNA